MLNIEKIIENAIKLSTEKKYLESNDELYKGLKYFDQIDIDNKTDLLLMLVHNHIDLIKYQDAEKYFNQLQIVNPNFLDTVTGKSLYARLLYYTNQYEECIRNYKSLLDESLTSDDLNKIGIMDGIQWSYRLLGQYDEAIKYSQQILEYQDISDTYRSGAYSTLGYYYYSKEEYNNSLKYFQQSIEIDDHSDKRSIFIYYWHIGYCYFMLNKFINFYHTLTKMRGILKTDLPEVQRNELVAIYNDMKKDIFNRFFDRTISVLIILSTILLIIYLIIRIIV